MDIVSHGLWGGLAAGRKNKKSFWTAFAFGILPDLLAFGPYFLTVFLGFSTLPHFNDAEPPKPGIIPEYVSKIYNVTHSIIIFTVIFLLIWLIIRRPLWELSAWGLHILFDIPTHSYQFFPTPFLWPISDFEIDGIPWSHAVIMIPNIILLILLFGWFFIVKRRNNML